jgi:hypothetical protein
MLPGALCPETFRQLTVEALRLGLMPTINQMRCVSSCHILTTTHLLNTAIFPRQCHRHHRDSGNDGARNSRWLRRGAGGAAADDYRIHDLLLKHALLYHRHALGSESVHRFGTPHSRRPHRYESSRSLPCQ